MKLCMFSPKGMELERGWPGRIDGDTIVQLAAQTLQAFFTGGGAAREHAVHPLDECDLRAPVLYPPSIRVFAPRLADGVPFFEFRSPFPVLGPEDELTYPQGTDELDFGAGLAAAIGADGAVGGFTLANLWSARDLARAERAAGFGPSKSGDFGISLGPTLLTPDEKISGSVVARVNGEERQTGDLGAVVDAWPQLLDHASRNTALRPGDVLVGAFPSAETAPLEPGDAVELEADGIGILRNCIGVPVPVVELVQGSGR